MHPGEGTRSVVYVRLLPSSGLVATGSGQVRLVRNTGPGVDAEEAPLASLSRLHDALSPTQEPQEEPP